jgi:hypothetical protein
MHADVSSCELDYGEARLFVRMYYDFHIIRVQNLT